MGLLRLFQIIQEKPCGLRVEVHQLRYYCAVTRKCNFYLRRENVGSWRRSLAAIRAPLTRVEEITLALLGRLHQRDGQRRAAGGKILCRTSKDRFTPWSRGDIRGPGRKPSSSRASSSRPRS